MVYNSCYIKVFVESNEEIVLNGTSQVGTFTHKDGGTDVIKPDDFYGERHSCTTNMVTCIQVKAAGSVTNGQEMGSDRTKVILTIPGQSFSNVEVNAALDLIYGDSIIHVDSSTFSMFLDDLVYGPDFGIYCHTSKDVIQSEKAALNMCLSGSNNPNDEAPPRGINKIGWAVKFSNDIKYTKN